MKNFRDHDLYVFDWDGTLNSMRLTLRINESLKRALHIWNRDSEVKDFTRLDVDLKRRLKREEWKNNWQTFMFDELLNFSKPKLHNDAIRLLKALRKRHKKIALFTNGRGHRVGKELHRLGIVDYFDSIISARDINSLKPNPTGLRLIMNRLHSSPKGTVYIGDMVDDIITARVAHVDSCGIAAGFDSYHRLKSAKPDYLFRSVEELCREIDQSSS